ncbi:hypothetical protein ACFQ0B_56175 [Nonomuraea thailandensis]
MPRPRRERQLLTAARADDLTTWVNAITTAAADHTWTLADLPATATSGTAVGTVADSAFTGTGLPLTATAGATWKTGDTYSPAIAFDRTTGTLAAGGLAVVTDADFSLSAWAKPTIQGTYSPPPPPVAPYFPRTASTPPASSSGSRTGPGTSP